MLRFIVFVAVSAMVLTLGAAAGIAQQSQFNDQDRKFIEKAAKGSMMEVQLGQMAQQKAASEDVRDFGRRMVEDHSKAGDKLKDIAQEADVSLPQTLDGKHRETVQELSSLEGESFDRQYMEEMVKDHEEDVELFEKEAEEGQHPELTQFAAETLDTLKEHHRIAKQIEQ